MPSVGTEVRLRGGDRLPLFAVCQEPPDVFLDTRERDAEILIVARCRA